jgi:hypothetical protein
MFRRLKYRLAFFWGRQEHRFSRILFASLLLTLLAYMYYPMMTKTFLYIDIGLWLLYWGSHKLEKWSFKHH